jgi:hypothetical protein
LGRSKNLPKKEHIAAAELHEKAARSHRTVADQYDNGDRDTTNRKSAEACSHAVRAYAASKHAHEKSTHHKKHA